MRHSCAARVGLGLAAVLAACGNGSPSADLAAGTGTWDISFTTFAASTGTLQASGGHLSGVLASRSECDDEVSGSLSGNVLVVTVKAIATTRTGSYCLPQALGPAKT